MFESTGREIPGIDSSIFTDDFLLVAFHDIENQVDSVEVLMKRGHKRYVLRVETYALNAQRGAQDEEINDVGQSYVVAGEVITGDLLIELREKSTADLAAFLIEQS